MKWIFAFTLLFLSDLCHCLDKDLDLYALYSFSRRQMSFSKGQCFLGNHFSEHSFSIGNRLSDSFGLEIGYSRLLSNESQRIFASKADFMVHHMPKYMFPVVYKSRLSLSGFHLNALFFHPISKKLEVFYGGGIKFARGRFERRLVSLDTVPCYWSRVMYKNQTIPYFSVWLEYKVNKTLSVRSFYSFEVTSRLKFESDIECFPLSVWPRNSHLIGFGLIFR